MSDATYSTVRASPEGDTMLLVGHEEGVGQVMGKPPSSLWHVSRRRVVMVSAVITLGLVAGFAVCAPSINGKPEGEILTKAPNLQPDAIQQKSESASLIPLLLKVLQEMAAGIHGAAEISEELGSSFGDAKKLFKLVNESAGEFEMVGEEVIKVLGKPIRLSMALKKQLHSLTPSQKQRLREKLLHGLNMTSLHDLRPADSDGCDEDEELYDGQCYKRCSLLTNGEEPVRASPFQCCLHGPPCTGRLDIKRTRCSGYAVSGDSSGNGCPRQPARCLQAEEFLAGLCYMRCSILTYGILPYRSTPDACCKSGSPLAMLEAGTCDTDAAYDVGDGATDAPAPPDAPLE
jgi:hypothetical protein